MVELRRSSAAVLAYPDFGRVLTSLILSSSSHAMSGKGGDFPGRMVGGTAGDPLGHVACVPSFKPLTSPPA